MMIQILQSLIHPNTYFVSLSKMTSRGKIRGVGEYLGPLPNLVC